MESPRRAYGVESGARRHPYRQTDPEARESHEEQVLIGHLDQVAVGTEFESRRSLYDAGVHRALQAGIVGRAAEGAESIVLSGGYPDDEDFGEFVIYTGSGGRDPNTGRQVADQHFVKQNKALVTSHLRGLPVRVIRGGRHNEFAPHSGFRYDGTYRVGRYWREEGRDGFQICRFRLEALAPDELPDRITSSKVVTRSAVTVQRIVRDTAMSRRVKGWHGYCCQVCGITLECIGGLYAEGAHIRPLGKPHNGPDTEDNLLCLCPNHHVLFDAGGFTIDEAYLIDGIDGIDGKLRTIPRHQLNQKHLEYHRNLWRSE
ncbi:YDG/SRA domain-containing protein [Sphingomicrobium astaxanthinifaciens]|uniref:YDG/SRA domain-containing protein n=1 Tax=Sphingomicrobium astaxanthinifaciens TaxID=1227949 RepID=UPI001FCC6822|nr:YDG/SRA domain-containing protein [Sphingomicrobium astaxanthinifaciens]MCJ7420952.1 HNH endonuclease [Sphingomicrobium astaxanthinifaciens]